jgi:hypothetical protein
VPLSHVALLYAVPTTWYRENRCAAGRAALRKCARGGRARLTAAGDAGRSGGRVLRGAEEKGPLGHHAVC